MAVIVLNDIHSRMNPTRMMRAERPRSVAEVAGAIQAAERERLGVSVSGSRHAMGGQQFGAGTVHLDMRGMGRLLEFDGERGLVRFEAGAEWPRVISEIRRIDQGGRWGIRQQTGASELTLGGAVSANIHGRGLRMAPFVGDVEALTVVKADEEVVTLCSRGRMASCFGWWWAGTGCSGWWRM